MSALGATAVGARWDEPSVLEDQTVGSLAGHLARGAVWVIGDYLDQPAPAVATIDSADDYFATHARSSDGATNRAIRDRGAAVAAAGWPTVVAQAAERLAALEVRLLAEPADRITVVAGGSMLLDDYLVTRLVEQVVHLDDLARSINADPWPIPDESVRLVLATGAWTGLRRSGAGAMVQALFRNDASALPVL